MGNTCIYLTAAQTKPAQRLTELQRVKKFTSRVSPHLKDKIVHQTIDKKILTFYYFIRI